MTLRMRALWAHDLKVRLCRERYRTFVRLNGGEARPVDMGRGPWNSDYCADPFLFRHEGINWIFYETLDKSGKGVLGCFREEDGKWVQQGIVLSESWHLSYPQVFEENGRVYMIPESCDAKRGYKEGHVALYEAVEFPFKWRKAATLIKEPLADSTLCKKDGWYYLSCFRVSPKAGAELWLAPSLTGPWTQHPQGGNANQSKRLRRNGGAFQVIDDRLYRIAQDCNGDYGKRLFKVPVTRLSPAEYGEGPASLLLDGNWPAGGLRHTYNNLDTPGGKLEVIDFKDYVPRLCPMRLFIWSRILLHTMFRLSIKRRKGFLVQLFGIQFVKGKIKERPALLQIRLDGRRK